MDDREAWGDQERSNKKTIYDPCPKGYRVAGRKRALFFEPDKNAAVAATFVANMDKYYYQIGNPASTLPLCGYINPDGTYQVGDVIVWNTHMDHDTVNLTYSMLISGGILSKGQTCRSIAGSVRCETYDE